MSISINISINTNKFGSGEIIFSAPYFYFYDLYIEIILVW